MALQWIGIVLLGTIITVVVISVVLSRMMFPPELFKPPEPPPPPEPDPPPEGVVDLEEYRRGHWKQADRKGE